MQRRFTIIQGGLAEQTRSALSGNTARARGWRIVLRRLTAIGEPEIAAWRALCDHQPNHDPFASPDYLLTAARHAGRGTDIAFAFAYAETAAGGAELAGVLPLTLPHPVWGGASVRLWHPPLAPRPVQPLVPPGAASAVLDALLSHLRADRPRTVLRLGRIKADGEFLRAVASSARLHVELHPNAAVPGPQLVAIAGKAPGAVIERVTAPDGIRDAVERYLAFDAERARWPLIADPAHSAIVRVVTRLFAQRGLASVELGSRDGAVVSGAIRLGRPGNQVLWRAIDLDEPVPVAPRSVDLDIRPVGQSRTNEPVEGLRLVTT